MDEAYQLASVAARCAVGAVFLTAAGSKVAGRDAAADFRAAVAAYLPSPVRPGTGAASTGTGAPAAPAVVTALAQALVGLELAVPVLLAARPTAPAGFALAVILLAGFTAGHLAARARGVRAPCACFGRRAEPAGTSLVVRNAVLIAVAVAGLAALPAGRGAEVPAGGVAVAATAGLLVALLLTTLDDLAALLSSSATPR